ncbi:50S ribosomal protein L22 [Desulfatibacillum aliphaticivorans]|uniref:Large ribosomal subunit protein uL22 n=1 Tax=Desulfatibacillum aliphaticivorans TaxID=218208 RepID=RL22_DESAL|nr:50S ribosomal protein L22 [Desulfatibacillum aliphaticivorans]B8FET0.1 RecName: Full=Large ribosomal subunit protein uL22; AltName: Full=50S ribosomal protein L22 [Desulfatibacillum aliphaticivorans]ACL03607.1 ribosomal protein L22 [Desulfatibacillum aliphaticivorans]
MQVKATAKYMRVSPQKVRKVADAVKGKPVEAGLNVLQFMPQKSAAMIAKVIRSAVANAEVGGVDVDDLVIKGVIADQGPTLKRFRARAQGRGARILKRTSHITVVLEQ